MKKLLLLLLLVSFATAQITGYVNDEAGIISDEGRITAVLQNLHESGRAEFAVVMIKSLEGKDIESVAFNMAEGVLGDKEKNNGLLLLVALDDHKYRFEVGRGLESVLNDAKVGRIGRTYLVDNFREGNYEKGIYEAVLAVNAILSDDIESEYYVTESQIDARKIRIYLNLFVIIIIFLTIVFSKKNGKDKYFNAAMMAAIMMRGGRHGGGGFGGFGGGSFGGGGSSGGW